MRGLPQVGLAAHIRRISATTSGFFPGRPRRCREFQRQSSLRPARCQPMTVSGWKIITAVRHWGQTRLRTTQKTRSWPLSLGLCAWRWSTVI